jgi:hypothetical protein
MIVYSNICIYIYISFIYSAFALNSVTDKKILQDKDEITDSINDNELGYSENSSVESNYMNNEDINIDTNDMNIDINVIQENEEAELGDNADDDNAYLLDIMNDTEQWLKDNM